jgi:hypothetical protein
MTRSSAPGVTLNSLSALPAPAASIGESGMAPLAPIDGPDAPRIDCASRAASLAAARCCSRTGSRAALPVVNARCRQGPTMPIVL